MGREGKALFGGLQNADVCRKEKHEEKRRRVLRTVLAAALFTAAPSSGGYDEERRVLVELGDSTFSEGVAELLERAKRSNEENAAFFVTTEEGEEAWVRWVSFQRGARDSITTDREAARREISAVLQENGAAAGLWGKGTEPSPRARVCYFHTHPLEALVGKGYVLPENVEAVRKGAARASIPPSWSDLALASGTPKL